MADKVQLTPMVTPETRDLVRRLCQERGCSQGDLVEQALQVFLTPARDEGKDESAIEAILHKVGTIETVLSIVLEIHPMVEAMHAVFQAIPIPEAHTPVPAQPVPVATYEQLYGPIEAAAPLDVEPATPLPIAAPSRRFRRWFVREEQA
jgi:hypothetical protein